MHALLRKKKYARRECVTYIKICYRSVLLVQCSSGAWPLILWTPSFWCWLLVCLWIMRLMLRTHSWLYLAHDTVGFLTAFHCYCFILSHSIISLILLHEKFLQFDWLRRVVFQLNLKYLHVKITNLLRVVVWTNNSMICTWYLANIPLMIFQNCLKFHSPNGSWNYV